MLDNYNIDIKEKQIIKVSKELDLYYNKNMEKIYSNYDEYYKEI
jgi:hypothetical protein